ncbi:MAG TPA: hypothetical protein VG253_04815 [Streptosporangiaceae bacterium]|nr:hypothetical protein [Streptosporangiaceae bacterium]
MELELLHAAASSTTPSDPAVAAIMRGFRVWRAIFINAPFLSARVKACLSGLLNWEFLIVG